MKLYAQNEHNKTSITKDVAVEYFNLLSAGAIPSQLRITLTDSSGLYNQPVIGVVDGILIAEMFLSLEDTLFYWKGLRIKAFKLFEGLEFEKEHKIKVYRHRPAPHRSVSFYGYEKNGFLIKIKTE